MHRMAYILTWNMTGDKKQKTSIDTSRKEVNK